MRFERITSPGDPRFEHAMALYRASFPFHEQRQAASQAAILAEDAYHFRLVYEGDLFVGLLLCWDTPRFIYVEHFCIEPALRGQGHGQRALALLRQQNLPVILEIDPPVDAIAIRRQHFYERAGFHANPFPHVHPAYHPDCPGHSLVVMSAPQTLSGNEYQRFFNYLCETVMGL